jgi:membrane protein
VLTLSLFSFHRFLPDGKRSIRTTFPGIALTISGIIVGSQLFAIYLQTIANYTALYAGLAGTMVAIVYLYGLSALILYGAEFNAALAEERGAGD